MDVLGIISEFGIPVAVACVFGFFIWKQNKFIQDELQKELRESFARLEGILIKLIDQQKLIQIELKGLEKTYASLVHIISKLSGNGMSHAYQRRDSDKKFR